ncbi:MAG TPA: ABC transporter substrate-binding protein [Syntrophothermus lipocalidus]|nr:ABC transporter substrate-binding protein [Syntrophothermus lipocalidus]
MSLAKHRVLLYFVLLALTVVFTVSGCDQNEKQSQTGPQTKPKIVFGDCSWDSIQVHNRIAAFICENGYGYPVDFVFGETLPIFQGVLKGDVQIYMETWIDNIRDAYDKALASGQVVDLGSNFSDAPQGWYIPAYMVKGDSERGIDPIAPDLKSIDDLPKYWHLFKDPEQPNKGRFHNGPAGWMATSINQDKIKAYGLDKYYVAFTTGSDSALAASIAAAYEQGKPWFGYYWEPTWVMGKYDMLRIQEPPYDEERWQKDHGCSYPPSKVTITVNPDLVKTAPDVVEFLKKYETTLEQNNAFLAYMHDNECDAQEAAIWFLKQYPEEWRKWVPAAVASKVETALAKIK